MCIFLPKVRYRMRERAGLDVNAIHGVKRDELTAEIVALLDSIAGCKAANEPDAIAMDPTGASKPPPL
jgi:hypothetical protein